MAPKSGVFGCLILALRVSYNNVMAQEWPPKPENLGKETDVCPCPRSENVGQETEKSASSIVERTSKNVGTETTETKGCCRVERRCDYGGQPVRGECCSWNPVLACISAEKQWKCKCDQPR